MLLFKGNGRVILLLKRYKAIIPIKMHQIKNEKGQTKMKRTIICINVPEAKNIYIL